jgi:uncharacterized membrane protein
MRAPLTDRTVELIIGRLLRIGVFTAAAVALAGGVWYLALHGGEITHYAAFRGEPASLTSIGGVISGIIALRPEAVIQLGLLLLIAVPILRVAVSVVAFALERDWLYVAVTLLVLGVLVFSLLGGTG